MVVYVCVCLNELVCACVPACAKNEFASIYLDVGVIVQSGDKVLQLLAALLLHCQRDFHAPIEEMRHLNHNKQKKQLLSLMVVAYQQHLSLS